MVDNHRDRRLQRAMGVATDEQGNLGVGEQQRR